MEFIRKKERLRHTRVVVNSGQAHVANGLSVQPDLILLKPVSVDQLTSLITRITLSENSPKAIPLTAKSLDDSTNLYNQSYFKNRLESVLTQSSEIERYLFAVLLFKLEPENNLMNHRGAGAWESILREVAGNLRSILRPTDTIARFGLDTFYILIENIPSGDIAIRIANRIQEILYSKLADIVDKIRFPIRVGILLGGPGYQKVNVILSDGKYALALASAQGDEYAQFYYQVSAREF